MPSMKAIKRRLGSVSTTKKIMKAMNMVAASKLQRNRSRLESALPFIEGAERIIHHLKGREEVQGDVFLKTRDVKNTAYLVITSDRGLCGNFNANLSEAALMHMNNHKNEKIIAVGTKGYDYFKRRDKKIIKRYSDVLETAFYEDAALIAGDIANLYTSGEVDEVYAAYTKYESALTHTPQVVKILPINSIDENNDTNNNKISDFMKYEPNLTEFFNLAVPLYLSAFIYSALLYSSTCEQAARMIGMDSAAGNASEIIGKLTRDYNRRRQASITQEISEVVSGASSIHNS